MFKRLPSWAVFLYVENMTAFCEAIVSAREKNLTLKTIRLKYLKRRCIFLFRIILI